MTPPVTRFVHSLVTILRLKGLTAFSVSITLVGIVAGALSAAKISYPLWVYISLYLTVYLLVICALLLRDPRYKYAVPAFFVYRDVKRGVSSKSAGQITGPHKLSVAAIAVGRQPDFYYDGGFRTMLEGNPKIIIPSNPRDVLSREKLTLPIFAPENGDDFMSIFQETGGSPMPLKIKRDLPGTQETEHNIAVRDLAGISYLARSFDRSSPIAKQSIDILPEHCIDSSYASTNDLLVVGGPDSNFWHSYLFELLWQRYRGAAVPLALSMRRSDEEGRGHYGAYALRSHISGLAYSLGLNEEVQVAFNERNNPTYGMILLASNPLSQGQHWSCFIAGTRSIGTVGASWALGAALEEMRDNLNSNFGSYVHTSEGDVFAGVSALICRVSKVHYAAWRNPQGVIQPGGTRVVPTDAPDNHYLDSYMPAEVEIFVNDKGQGRWEVFCSSS